MKRDSNSLVTIAIFFLLFAICFVPGTAWGDRFRDNGDGTVTDTKSGLMWAKTDNQGDITWSQAQRWVKYTFPYTIQTRYDNWRLPTIDELKSLFEKKEDYEGYPTECGLSVKMVPEIRITCGWVWSAEIRSITAKAYNFQRGYPYTDRKVHYRGYRALAVRNIE